jgi:hypothetical protein
MDLSAVHDMRATRRRIGFNLTKIKSIAALASRYRLCYGDAIGFGRKG